MVKTYYIRFGKRIFSLLIAVPALVLFSPMLLLVAILVKLDSAGPVFFLQKRLGQGGDVFTLYKFRTMLDRPRKPSREIKTDHPEVTSVGRLLRRFKIDELPQLLNVIKGDMSVVGPRPGLPSQLDAYTELAHQRLKVKPGLTGLAQINGNIHLSWEERWVYDAEYVERLSFVLDVRIILQTVLVVLLGERNYLNPPDRFEGEELG